MAAPWPPHAATPVTAGDIDDDNVEIGFIPDEAGDHSFPYAHSTFNVEIGYPIT